MCQWTPHSPLLKEGLPVHHVLADRTGLPSPVRSRRVDLVQALTPVGVPPGDEQRHAVRSHATTRVSAGRSFFPFAADCEHGSRAFPMAAHSCCPMRTQPSQAKSRKANMTPSTAAPHSPRLRRLLHHIRNLLDQHLGGRILPIHLPVRLRDLPCFGDQHAEVGAHARVDETDVGADGRDLLEDRGVEEERGGFLLGSEDDAVGR